MKTIQQEVNQARRAWFAGGCKDRTALDDANERLIEALKDFMGPFLRAVEGNADLAVWIGVGAVRQASEVDWEAVDPSDTYVFDQGAYNARKAKVVALKALIESERPDDWRARGALVEKFPTDPWTYAHYKVELEGVAFRFDTHYWQATPVEQIRREIYRGPGAPAPLLGSKETLNEKA